MDAERTVQRLSGEERSLTLTRQTLGAKVNYNYGSGTFNNVHGNQHNTNNHNHFTGPLLIIGGRSQNRHTSYLPSSPAHAAVSERYRDVIYNIHSVCRLLHGFMSERLPQDSSLQLLYAEMTKFATAIAYVAKALDIIDQIPGKLKLLHRFEQVRDLVRGFNCRLYAMDQDIRGYEAHLHRYINAGFWRGLFLHVFIHYRWGQLVVDIRAYLKDNQEILEQFLHFLATRCWQAIITDQHAKELEQLIREMHLQPDPAMHHLKMLKFLVRDHMGRLLPIPLEFCTSWADFEIIVKHYCLNVPGGDLVQRDNWELVRTTDNAVIDRSNFMSSIKPEMELDISIVLQMLASSLSICPQRGHTNTWMNQDNGWLYCYECDQQYRVVSSLPSTILQPERYGKHGSNIALKSSWIKRAKKTLLKRIANWSRNDGASKGNMISDLDPQAVPGNFGLHEAFSPLDLSAYPKFHRISVRAQRIVHQRIVRQGHSNAASGTPTTSEEEARPPFDFADFLDKMKTMSAEPVTKYIRSFLSNFSQRTFTVKDQVKLIHDFLDFIHPHMREIDAWKDATDLEFDNAREGMEKLITNRLFELIFAPQAASLRPAQSAFSDDLESDRIISERIASLGWIEEKHLGIPIGKESKGFLNFAQQELLKINDYKAPRDKLICIQNCRKVIMGLIRHLDKEEADFNPMLVYVVLKANPDHLMSNIQYINRFRNPEKLLGEAGNAISYLISAVSFIDKMNHWSLLNITQAEFERNVETSSTYLS